MRQEIVKVHGYTYYVTGGATGNRVTTISPKGRKYKLHVNNEGVFEVDIFTQAGECIAYYSQNHKGTIGNFRWVLCKIPVHILQNWNKIIPAIEDEWD